MSFACTLCNSDSILVRVSYRSENKLFMGVPIRVCTNEKCVQGRGGQVYEHKELTKPPSETEMGHGKSTPEPQDEYELLKLIYEDWVKAGKPGYFSDWIGAIEDVTDAH